MAWFGKKKTEDTPATVEVTALPDDEQAAAPAKRGWLGYFQAGLEKTRETLFTDIRDLLKTEGRIVDEDFCRDLYAILVKTDMGPGPAAAIRDQIHYDFRARKVHMP